MTRNSARPRTALLLLLVWLALGAWPAGSPRASAQGSFGAEPMAPQPDQEVLLHLKTRAEVFTGNLAQGRIMQARPEMGDMLRRTLTDESLGILFNDLHRSSGRLRAIEPGTVRLERDGRVVAMVPMVHERRTLAAQVVFERQGPLAKIVGFSVMPWERDAQGGDEPFASERRTTPPPDYARPGAFRETAVLFRAPGGPEIPGRVALPATASESAPVPAALILSGGADDVEGAIGSNNPMRDLAQGLAANGVATLRFAPRSAAAPESFNPYEPYTADQALLDDAKAALEALRSVAEVDGARVAIVGHGIGGWLAPVLAASEGGVASLVLVNPPGTDLADSIGRQSRRMAQFLPPSERELIEGFTEAGRLLGLARDGALDPGEPVLGAPAEYWRTLLQRRPGAAAGIFRGPVLVIHPESSFLTDTRDRNEWAAAIAEGNPRSGTKAYADLNDLMIRVGPLRSIEALDAPGNFDRQAMLDIASFLRTGRVP